MITIVSRLYGDYESLSTGHTIDALVDFTGGVAERLDLVAHGLQSSSPHGLSQIMQILHEACDNNALIITSIKVSHSRGIVCAFCFKTIYTWVLETSYYM